MNAEAIAFWVLGTVSVVAATTKNGTASCPEPPDRFTVMVLPFGCCVPPSGVCTATCPRA